MKLSLPITAAIILSSLLGAGAGAAVATWNDVPPAMPSPTYDSSLPPCEEEDASTPRQPLPCVWDASISGNGTGLSYVVNPDDSIAMISLIPRDLFDQMGK